MIALALAGAAGYLGAKPAAEFIAGKLEPAPGIASGVKRVAIAEKIKLPTGAAIAIAAYFIARKVL